MTEQQLNETLGKIGKEVFVEFFYGAFADLNLRNSDIAGSILAYQKAKAQKAPSYDAAHTRVSKARSILKSGNGRVALLNCSRSNIPEELQHKAARLANA